MKLLIASITLVALAMPALAAEFYIVRDTSTKKCMVVEQRPTSSTVVVMGNGKVYATRAEAETAIKTVCVD
jgi:vancomycin permeability regulator SanA